MVECLTPYDGLRVRASPEALCCVLEHDTKYPVLSTGSPPPPPMKSEGYCFGVGRLCTCLSVCLSVCPPVLPETYLSTYQSDLVHSLHEWIVPWTVPSADPEGGGGQGDLPRKITSYIFSIGISNWNPPAGKSWTPLKNVGPPQEL